MILFVIVSVVVALLVTGWLVDRRERRVRGGRSFGVNPAVSDMRKDLGAGGACRAFDNDEAARWTAEGRRKP